MGADLFGSLAESTCAALVVSSTSYELIETPEALYFPLSVTAAGLLASFLSVCCVHLFTVTVKNVQSVLKAQIGLSTLLMTACVVGVIYTLPEKFMFYGADDVVTYTVTRW
jgi:Na+/H+-translocating membrane pyrophosphatase